VHPKLLTRFVIDGPRLRAEPGPVRPPSAGEVVVQVAGVALGVDPNAEVAGRVVAVGEAAGDWLGRRVVVPRVLPCGDCDRCRRGRAATCAARAARAGLASHETVPAKYLCSVEPPLWPAALDGNPDVADSDGLWRLAALADAAAAPYGALMRAGIGPGELVVVVGGGVRGAFAVAIARAKGAHPVLVDASPARRERAAALGARFAVDGALAPTQLREALAREAAALGLPLSGAKLLETTATAQGRAIALALLGDGGTAVLLDGGDQTAAPLACELFAREETQVIGASACHPDLLPELCALVVRGELPLTLLTTRFTAGDPLPTDDTLAILGP